MKNKILFSFISLLLVFFLTAPAYAQPVEHFKPFEQFIGEWKLDNSVQVFELGVGKMSVIGKSYRIGSNQSRTLVSEGMWFWHPGQQKIKRYVVYFFDYTTQFEDGKMTSDLSTNNKEGTQSSYKEIMQITEEEHRHWPVFKTRNFV